MGLLPRLAKRSLAVVTLVALTSLPVSPPSRIPGNAFMPRIAWAGGSPDETLNPQPPIDKRAAAMRPITATGGEATRLDAARQTTLRRLSLFERFGLAYRIFRHFVVRF